MNKITHECKKCGASFEENIKECPYCGTWYEDKFSLNSIRNWPQRVMSIVNPPQDIGDFGIPHDRFIFGGILITLGLYILGWFFEDTGYWLDEKALLIWIVAMPLLLFFMALLWKADHRVVIIGLAFSIIIFVVHISIIKVIRGKLWDDHLGIAAMVAAASFSGWLLGRVVHGVIRWRKLKRAERI